MMKQLSITLVFDYSYSLNQFSFFDIGQTKEFIDFNESKKAFAKTYKNCIRYELEALVSMTTKSKTPISAYFSGTFLKLLYEVDRAMLGKLNAAVQGHLELMTGTYSNSLSPVFSLKSTLEEVRMHNDYLETLFSKKATKCYLFENVYSNDISKQLSTQGITTSFAGAINWYLDGQTDAKILRAHCSKDYSVLLPDQDMGNSIFKNLKQKNHFLQFDIDSLMKLNGVKNLVERLKREVPICSLDEQISKTETEKKYSIKTPIMSGLRGVSLDAIRSNALQSSALKHYYQIKTKINSSVNPKHLESWILLGHSDYFSQMGHDYEDTAYDAYANYMNILNDLELTLDL